MIYYFAGRVRGVSHHIHLGLTLCDDLTWDKHIDRVCTESLKAVNLLKRPNNRIPRATKLKIYKTFIQPKLEYADAVFESFSEKKNKQLKMSSARRIGVLSGI
jgi:hypothetical protein